MVHEHPTTGTEVGSRGRALAEVPAVVGVASGIVQGLPSRARLPLTNAVQGHGVCSTGVWFWSHSVKDSLTALTCQVSLDRPAGAVGGQSEALMPPFADHIQMRSLAHMRANL
jgi:hypothetical protein